MGSTGETMELNTSLGKIRGLVVTAPNGKKVAKFLGIPYAKQPIGKLRFKPLEQLDLPLGTDESPFEALKIGPSSIQDKNIPTSTTVDEISEKCIFINIYMPVEESAENLRPVFFNIHAGAFYLFSGGETIYDLTSFVAIHNVVGVSFNYRLGVLGFLSLPPVIEDNLGLKDQQFALKWVHQHIESFGGDANKITIYGCSAGGASCHFHSVNEESSALFTRAIIASGCINPVWSCVTPKTQHKRVQWVLRQLGCPKNLTNEQILEYLQSLDEKVFIHVFDMLNILNRAILPVDTFITDRSKSVVPLGKKPLLIGVTAEEGNIYPETMFPRGNGAESFTKSRASIAKFASEKFFCKPLRLTIEPILKKEDYPLYGFLFDYETETRGKDICIEKYHKKWIGKFHTLDMMFFMGHCCKNSLSLPETNETDMVVNKATAELVQKFMTENVDEIDLPIYKADSRLITKITKDGLKEEECDYRLFKDKFLLTKGALSGALLTISPEKF